MMRPRKQLHRPARRAASGSPSVEPPDLHDRRDPRDRRRELVHAAFELIATKGLEGLRTRDVAARVGINISTLHYHFETKEALLAGVVEHVTHRFKTMHSPLPHGATPLDELRQLFGGHAQRRRGDSQIDIVMQEIMLRSRRDPEVRAAFDAMLSTWRAIVGDIVARCVRDRLVRDDVDPPVVAAVITSFLIGASTQLGIAPAGFSLADAAQSLMSWLSPPPASRATPNRR